VTLLPVIACYNNNLLDPLQLECSYACLDWPWSVSVGLLDAWVSPATIAELIEILFIRRNRMGSRNHVFDGSTLTTMNEWCMLSGDLSVTVAAYYSLFHLLLSAVSNYSSVYVMSDQLLKRSLSSQMTYQLALIKSQRSMVLQPVGQIQLVVLCICPQTEGPKCFYAGHIMLAPLNYCVCMCVCWINI